jgi:hypothetical protein
MDNILSSILSGAETVFAQLCLDTVNIVIKDPHVIDIVSLDANRKPQSKPVKITLADFKKAFYGNVTSGENSPFQLTGSANNILKYYNLNDTSNKGIYGLLGNNNAGVSLEGPVTGFWSKDIGRPIDCWTTCSRMHIFNEIVHTHNLKNLDCNICCSLCWGELINMIKSEQHDVNTETLLGAKLGLRIIYKNNYDETKDVEARIHFEIV